MMRTGGHSAGFIICIPAASLQQAPDMLHITIEYAFG